MDIEAIEHMERTGYLDHTGQYEKLRAGIMRGTNYRSYMIDPASWCIDGGGFRDVADMLATAAMLSADKCVMVTREGSVAFHTVYQNTDGSFSIYARD